MDGLLPWPQAKKKKAQWDSSVIHGQGQRVAFGGITDTSSMHSTGSVMVLIHCQLDRV